MRLLALLLFAACANTAVPEQIDWPILAYPLNETTLDRPDVAAAFESLLRQSVYGRVGEERAGFLVYEDSAFRVVPWPATHVFHSAEWSGKIPAGTVAVVHTHPPDQPLPSARDRMEAQRVGVPIIVVTVSGATVAMPDGAVRRLGGKLR